MVSLCGLWARTAHLCTEFEGHSFIREIGSRAAGQFVVRGQELPTAYVRAKFEDRSFTRLRNIVGGGQNFEIGSLDVLRNAQPI